ncbi:DNA-binding protein [bacterium]|nr:MAG: DNA-binding protein [bacterium]
MEPVNEPEKPLTVADVAATLGVTPRRVNAMITAGRLVATKFGDVWMINPSDVEAVRVRKAGNPGTPRIKKES